MLDWALSVLFVFLTVWAVIAVHELGHYYAGRQIVGIPATEIKLVDPYFPRYVALRDNEEWVSPTDLERYREVYSKYDEDGEHIERYVAAGELVQAAVVAPVAFLVGLLFSVDIAVTVLFVSLFTTLLFVVIDAVGTVYRGRPSGDYSILWQATPRLPLFLLLGFVSVHVVPLLVLT